MNVRDCISPSVRKLRSGMSASRQRGRRLLGCLGKTAPAKAASMPAAGGTAKKEAVKATTTDGPRWDVQIGAFTSKENASALAEKTKSQGLGSYIVTEQKSGAPLYKVRVKNPNKTRGEAAALAKRLEADGHPVFLVETK